MATVWAPSCYFRAIACALAMGTLAPLLAACDADRQSSATAAAAAGTDTSGSVRQLEASVGDVTV